MFGYMGTSMFRVIAEFTPFLDIMIRLFYTAPILLPS